MNDRSVKFYLYFLSHLYLNGKKYFRETDASTYRAISVIAKKILSSPKFFRRYLSYAYISWLTEADISRRRVGNDILRKAVKQASEDPLLRNLLASKIGTLKSDLEIHRYFVESIHRYFVESLDARGAEIHPISWALLQIREHDLTKAQATIRQFLENSDETLISPLQLRTAGLVAREFFNSGRYELSLALNELIFASTAYVEPVSVNWQRLITMQAAAVLGDMDRATSHARLFYKPVMCSLISVAEEAFGSSGKNVLEMIVKETELDLKITKPSHDTASPKKLLALSHLLDYHAKQYDRFRKAMAWDLPETRHLSVRESPFAREPWGRVRHLQRAILSCAAKAGPQSHDAMLAKLRTLLDANSEPTYIDKVISELRAVNVRNLPPDLKLALALVRGQLPTKNERLKIAKKKPFEEWIVNAGVVERFVLSERKTQDFPISIFRKTGEDLLRIAIESPDLFAAKMPGVFLAQGHAGLNHYGEVIADEIQFGSSPPKAIVAQYQNRCMVECAPKTIEISEPIVVFSDFSAFRRSYFHLLLQFLPRLALARSMKIVSDRRILVSKDLPKFAFELLAKMGFPDTEIFQLNENENVFLHDAIQLSPAYEMRLANSAEVEALRNAVAPNYGARHARQKFFISRENYPNRCLVNEAEVAHEAGRLGYSVIKPEQLSIDEQIKIFSRASVIAGASGAALANMVFAPRGCLIVCFTPDFRLRAVFAANACALGHSFRFALGQLLVDNLPGHVTPPCPYYIDIETARNALTC